MIRNLKPVPVAEFLGKNTTTNLTTESIGYLTAAQNCMILADQTLRRAPGYGKLISQASIPGTGPLTASWDFQRSVDGLQFTILQRGTALSYATVIGGVYGTPVLLATLQSAVACQFVANVFICYLSNGTDALRLVDKGGTLTAYQWGITPPTYTPTVSQSAGTLTLTYGRRYVASDVAKYTDSLGIERITVSAPTPFSAFSGPLTNQVNVVGGFVSSTDPQVNYRWIFATSDSPIDTSATYYFAAEIMGADTSWADSLLDTQLDQTRLAPFDNYPAPPSEILTQFQSRQVLLQKNQIRLSGGADILLGIPDEAFPLSLFFNVPAGARTATAATTLNSGSTLAVSNGDTWFDYSGYDAATFTEADRIAAPGECGRWAGAQTPFGFAFVSPSKRFWIWDGQTNPSELSAKVSNPLVGTLGMDSISADTIDGTRVHWYSYGQRHFLVVVSRSVVADGNGMDWVSIWGVPAEGITSISSSGVRATNALYMTDKFPLDYVASTADATVSGVPTIYIGTQSGDLMSFPLGWQDNKQDYPSTFAHAWFAPIDGKARFFWIDLICDTSNDFAVQEAGGLENIIQVAASVIEAPENTPRGATGTKLEVKVLPTPRNESGYALRASLQIPETSSGRYIRVIVSLMPSGVAAPFDVAVQKMLIYAAPIFSGAA